MQNKKPAIGVNFDGIEINGVKYKDWDEQTKKDFWEGFESNTLGNPNKYPYHSSSSSSHSSTNSHWTDKFNMGDPNKDEGHWVTMPNKKHIFIKDKKGDNTFSVSDKNTNANMNKNANMNTRANKNSNSKYNKVPNNTQDNTLKNFDNKKEIGETDKKVDFEKQVDWENKKIEASKIPLIGKGGATLAGGKDSAGMLNIAEGKEVWVYTKDAVKVDNIGDAKIDDYNKGELSKWRKTMAEKITKQFRDFNYKLGEIKGYIFKSNSAPVKRIKQDPEFKRILSENKNLILKGENFSGRFYKGDHYKAYASVDFFNCGFDDNGNLRIYMFDTYDFNKGERPLVEAGRRQMLEGKLKGFFSLHEIIVEKNEIDKIMN